MTNAFRFFTSLVLMLVCLTPVSAQSAATSQAAAAELSILIGERQIKFTPLKGYEQLRLEIFNHTGELIYASDAIAEAELNYNLHDGNGQPLAPGLYAYTLSIKAPGAETPRQHQGHFILEKSNDQIWLTSKDGSVGAEVTGGALTVARSPERTTAGYLATRRTIGERAGAQRATPGRTVADKQNGVTREDVATRLNISGSGTTNRLTKWLDGPNGAVGDSLIHETPSGNLGVGTTAPGGVLDIQRASAGTILQRFWNTGGGGAAIRYVAATGQTSQLQMTDLAEWLMSIAGNNTGMQFRVRGVGTPNNETELNNSARLTILRNGNVGVGTTVPAAKLEAVGDIRSSALRQELTATSPNVINGFIGTGSGGAKPGNRVTVGVIGASIGGGGFNGTLYIPEGLETLGDRGNRVTDSFSTVGGGLNNRAGNDNADVLDAVYSTVGGGFINTASGFIATVGGGNTNTASGYQATVGGGGINTASGPGATIGGGGSNTASGGTSTVGGGGNNSASGYSATVSGGYYNRASESNATVGGGVTNTAGGEGATVGGGATNTANGVRATVGGGSYNTASGSSATVGGGGRNAASGSGATVGGGGSNAASDGATVGGGFNNTASSTFSIVPGGVMAQATHYGELAFASGSPGAAGDAQTSLYNFWGQTGNNMPTELLLNGDNVFPARLTVASGRALTFDILVTGKTSINVVAGYRFTGVVKNDNGTTSLVGSVINLLTAEDPGATSWNVTVTADNANDALLITVTGATGTTIRWHAAVRTSELSFQ